MKQFRDVTIGEVLAALRVYRPFFALAAIIALLLIGLPADDDGGRATSRVAVGDGATGALEVSPSGDPAVDAGGSEAALATAAPSSAARGTSRGRLSPSAGPVTGVGGGPAHLVWPALGSAQALAAPDCDRATGYLRMPSKVFNLPCVPLWPAGADNGGATARGVTAKTIRIVAYHQQVRPEERAATTAAGAAESDANLQATLDGLLKLYERHTELYGRKLEIIHVRGSGPEPENHRADAIAAFNQYKPFATVGFDGTCVPASSTTGGFQFHMALRGVHALCSTTDSLANMKAARGHLWMTPYAGVMLHEQHLLFVAEMICKRLKGHPAKWAGDPSFRVQARKFGYLYIDSPANAAATKTFTDALGKCGVRLDAVGVSENVATAQEQIPNAIAKFKASGDNVVVLDASFLNGGVASKQASLLSYSPEWLASGFGYTDATLFVRLTWDLNQARALYALREVPLVPPKEKADGVSLYRWENGQDPPAKLLGQDSQMPVWHALFAGIQLAGPNLTEDTFRAGLLRMAPYGGSYTGGVSTVAKAFGNRGFWPWESATLLDTSAVKDTTFTWWSNSASGDDEAGNSGNGMMMFPDAGKRYRLGQLPAGVPDLFNAGNGLATIADLGKGDKPSTYENRKNCKTRFECWAPK